LSIESGFSQSTILPAFAAAIAISQCKLFGVQMPSGQGLLVQRLCRGLVGRAFEIHGHIDFLCVADNALPAICLLVAGTCYGLPALGLTHWQGKINFKNLRPSPAVKQFTKWRYS
jgi:hypothetical protein